MNKNIIFTCLLVVGIASFALAKSGNLAQTSGKITSFTHACSATPSFVQPAIPGVSNQPKTYTEISCVAPVSTNGEIVIGDKGQMDTASVAAGFILGGDTGNFPQSITLSAGVIGCMKLPGPVASASLNCVAIYD